jgi:hypothetical protein
LIILIILKEISCLKGMGEKIPVRSSTIAVTFNSKKPKIPQILRNRLSDLVTISLNKAYCVSKFSPHKILTPISSVLRISKSVAFRFH